MDVVPVFHGIFTRCFTWWYGSFNLLMKLPSGEIICYERLFLCYIGLIFGPNWGTIGSSRPSQVVLLRLWFSVDIINYDLGANLQEIVQCISK